jgi:hypothetical protein
VATNNTNTDVTVHNTETGATQVVPPGEEFPTGEGWQEPGEHVTTQSEQNDDEEEVAGQSVFSIEAEGGVQARFAEFDPAKASVPELREFLGEGNYSAADRKDELVAKAQQKQAAGPSEF